MMISEIEKCMIAMVDDFELKRMEDWIRIEEEMKDHLED
jgi:hypothetical protein